MAFRPLYPSMRYREGREDEMTKMVEAARESQASLAEAASNPAR